VCGREVPVRSDASRTPDATAGQSGEELRLWADYYEAVTRALEIVRAGNVTRAAFIEICSEHLKGAAALERLQRIRGVDA
jgi:hypothetical protein